MGIFRFILAMLVFLNHIPGHSLGFDIANAAVIGFYFISGLLVTRSLNQFSLSHGRFSACLHFYIDRIIRLWPLFFISIILIVILRIYITHAATLDGSLLHTISANLTILPLAFSMATNHPQIINGVTWSLGAEFIFYILLPVFFFLPQKIKIFVCWLSVILHIACLFLDKQAIYYYAYQGIGFQSDRPASLLYGYFFPLFSIAPFLMGSLHAISDRKWPVGIAYVGYVLVFFLFGQAGSAMANTGVFEVMFGILLFVPLAVLLEKHKFESASLEKLNSYLGLLSYPVFIIHVFAIDYVTHLFPSNTKYKFLVAYLIVFAMCPILIMLQKKVDTLRYKIRGFGRTKDIPGKHNQTIPIAD